MCLEEKSIGRLECDIVEDQGVIRDKECQGGKWI